MYRIYMYGTQERDKVEVVRSFLGSVDYSPFFFSRSKLISQKSLKMNGCKLEGEKLITAWKAISNCNMFGI